MAGHAATPNSECTEHVTPADINGSKTSAITSMFGKNGIASGTGADASNDNIVIKR